MNLTVLSLLLLPPLSAQFPEPQSSGTYTTGPLPAEEAARQWKLPEGFQATVFASEPDIRQPIAMAFDDRGRLWVAECYTYAEAQKKFESSLRDRIVVLEDTDADGRADRRTVFCDGLERLSSLEIGFGGVWALTSPALVHIPDVNGDDRPDGPARVVLDGFDWLNNHHTMANGLRWGPDGWLYGRHGIQATSALGTPGAPAEARARTNGGIWRYHPVRGTVEVVCEGTTNPWGMDWNELGEGFFINTVIGHLWQAIPGAHFRRMHGVDLRPHVYEVIDQFADHVHWATGEVWHAIRKGATPATQAAGGGHAHTGLLFYGGDNWPDEWRGRLLTINFHGRRLNVDHVEREPGRSGYIGRHGQDIAFSADPWFRGIDLLYGPDGGVFVSDWSDTGECHDNDGVHRQSGRIFKLTYGKPGRPAVPDLGRYAPVDLIPLLSQKNEFYWRHARRRFQELAARGETVGPLQATLRSQVLSAPGTVDALRALWCLNALNGVDRPLLLLLLKNPDEHLRSWAIRLLLDDREAAARDQDLPQELARLAEREPSPLVRLALASGLQRLPLASRPAVALPLLDRSEDAADHNLPLLVWYGLMDLGDAAPRELARLGVHCKLPATLRCLARRLALRLPADEAPLSELLLGLASEPKRLVEVLRGVREAIRGERGLRAPEAWSRLEPSLSSSVDPELSDLYFTVGAAFGDAHAIEAARQGVLDSGRSAERRRSALRTLIECRAPGLQATCEAVFGVEGLSVTAADGLALDGDEKVLRQALNRFVAVSKSEQGAVLGVFLSRPLWAGVVLEALSAGQIPRETFTAYHARQVRGLKNELLDRKLEEVWGAVRDTSEQKAATLERWRAVLTPEAIAAADRVKGRETFVKVCGNCHVLNGEGGKIGPELTGSARDNLDYLLQNLLDPSAAVAREFQLTTVVLKDGRVLSGYVRSRDDRLVVLQTITEAVSIPVRDIASSEDTRTSLMPEGLIDPLKEAEVLALVAYLQWK